MSWQGSVVRIWDGLPSNNGKFVGTGFFIDSQTLLTAKHVVENIQYGIYLDGTPGGGKEKVESENIIMCERDIAILKTSRSFANLPNLSILSTELSIGQQLTFAGYIDESQSLHTLTSEVSGHVSTLHTWRTQGNIGRGMSGGPVVNINGNIVGIIQARDADKNLSYLIPSEVIYSCLNKAGLIQLLKKAPLYNVPKLPAHFINRSEHIDKIKGLLLQDRAKSVGITGISHTVGLQGMGGIGKSILASAIAYDNEIRDTFHDGIIWVTVGQNPDILNLQSLILENLGELGIIPETPEHGLNLLNNYFRDKKILLILDDVWKINDIYYFDISSTELKTLITTRHSQVLRSVSAEEYKIDVLSTEQAMLLLRIHSNWGKDEMPKEAELIVKECGALPLAISMIGAMLKNKPQSRWIRTLEHLRNSELQSIRQQFSNYPYPDLFVALHVSVEAQPSIIQDVYLKLAVFPQDMLIPESVLEIYLGKEDLQPYDIFEVIDELLDASLIFRYDEENLILHDLQNDYIRSQCPDIQGCHRMMVSGYEQAYPLGFHTISESSRYFHNKIIYHLEQTKDFERIKSVIEKLLSNTNYLSWSDILVCSQLINKTLKELALQVLKTSQLSSTLTQCLKILGNEAKDEARRLLALENQDPDVISVCLNLLRGEAKNEARRLLALKNQDPKVISVCLNLLGSEAKNEARRLLILENQNKNIIAACLSLLGTEAKDEARQLLTLKNQHPDVISVCLKLLGSEAKDEARRLLALENQHPDVIPVCLNLLGSEAKNEARRLLILENQNKNIITACLSLLGAEAKDEARRLLTLENQYKEVITVCLNLLGAEAKDEARRLLTLENQHPEVITVCLNLLGAEAKDEARRLLTLENQYKEVITACLKLLGAEAKDKAQELLKLEDQTKEVISVCLEILGVDAVDFVKSKLKKDEWNKLDDRVKVKILNIPIKDKSREQRAIEILVKWKSYFRPLVTAALTVFDKNPQKVSDICTQILQSWYKDYMYYEGKRINKYSGHIRKAMRHPELLHLSKLVAIEVIKKEEEKPGFIDEEFLEFSQFIIQGNTFEWTDPI